MERSLPETVEVKREYPFEGFPEDTTTWESVLKEVDRLNHENALLTTANANLTGGFLTVMKDLRKYCTWITRSYLGGSIVNPTQYQEALQMGQTLDAIAKVKGWKLLEDENPVG